MSRSTVAGWYKHYKPTTVYGWCGWSLLCRYHWDNMIWCIFCTVLSIDKVWLSMVIAFWSHPANPTQLLRPENPQGSQRMWWSGWDLFPTHAPTRRQTSGRSTTNSALSDSACVYIDIRTNWIIIYDKNDSHVICHLWFLIPPMLPMFDGKHPHSYGPPYHL